MRSYRTLNAKHIISVLEQKGCASDCQVGRGYLPSSLPLGCNHLWLRISREAWLGPCNSRSHEFSVKLSPRANITWRALTWLLAGVSCWLAVSQWSLLLSKWPLPNLLEVLISMAVGFLQSKGSERKRKSIKQKPSSFQPNCRGDCYILLAT